MEMKKTKQTESTLSRTRKWPIYHSLRFFAAPHTADPDPDDLAASGEVVTAAFRRRRSSTQNGSGD